MRHQIKRSLLFRREFAVRQLLWAAVLVGLAILNISPALRGQTITIVSHIDTVQRILIDHDDLAQRQTTGHVDLPRLREGGINAPFFALWVPTYYRGAEAVRRTLDLRDAMQELFDAHPDLIELAVSAADVERIVRSGKIAAVLQVEGGHQIDNDLRVLRMYYDLGIRGMTLTHFRNTDWADASTDVPVHNGLTDFGKQVVREMNRLGMIIDVSHVSDKTFYDALAVSTKPIIASHSSCRAIADIPRNMTDDMIRALASKGGVMGISFGEGFLSPKDSGFFQRDLKSNLGSDPTALLTGVALDDYAAKQFHEGSPTSMHSYATLDDVVAHIDHAVKIAGIDHVGIGSDYDGIDFPPKGLEDVSKMPALVSALRKKGYSEQDIQKIFGGNMLRILREVVGK